MKRPSIYTNTVKILCEAFKIKVTVHGLARTDSQVLKADD